MSLIEAFYLVGGILAAGLLIYLLVALFRPDTLS